MRRTDEILARAEKAKAGIEAVMLKLKKQEGSIKTYNMASEVRDDIIAIKELAEEAEKE
jgi:hypothetical protein